MQDNLSIGGVRCIELTVATADTDDGVAQLLKLHTPTAEIHLMNALVSKVAIAVLGLPMPIVMKTRSRQRSDRRRATPEVEVDGGWNGIFARRSNCATAFITKTASDLHIANVSVADVLDCRDHAWIRSRLETGLADTLLAASHFDHPATFPHAVADRFLDVYVLARRHRPDCR